MKTKKLTKELWDDIISKKIPFTESMEVQSAHVGWNYFYKGVKASCPNMNKEQAFNASYDMFTERFGSLGVIEDDISFSPILLTP